MELSNFILTVCAGIVGTIGMTLVMYGYSVIFHKNTKVIHILGIMVTGSTSKAGISNWKAILAGTLGHFGVGIIFSLSYFLLWNWGVFTLKFGDSVLIGLLSGILAVFVWGGFLKLHYNPPKLNLPHYFVALMLAHLVFGIITVNLYTMMADDYEFWFEFRQRVNAMT